MGGDVNLNSAGRGLDFASLQSKLNSKFRYSSGGSDLKTLTSKN